MKFSIKDFFSKCDQIRRLWRNWSHLLKKIFKGKLHFLCSVYKLFHKCFFVCRTLCICYFFKAFVQRIYYIHRHDNSFVRRSFFLWRVLSNFIGSGVSPCLRVTLMLLVIITKIKQQFFCFVVRISPVVVFSTSS